MNVYHDQFEKSTTPIEFSPKTCYSVFGFGAEPAPFLLWAQELTVTPAAT